MRKLMREAAHPSMIHLVVPVTWIVSPPRNHASPHSRGDCPLGRVARLLVLASLFGFLARSQELRIIVLPGAERPGGGIPSRISIVDRAGLAVGQAWVVGTIPDRSAEAVFSNGLHTVLLVTGVDGTATLPYVYTPTPSRVVIEFDATRGGMRGSASIDIGGWPTPTVSRWSIPKQMLLKKLPLVGAVIASGLTGYLVARRGSAPMPPAAAPSTPPLAIGIPVITIGRP